MMVRPSSFARDTYSLLYLQSQKLRTPIVEFGLDGTFGIAVRDEKRAQHWLRRIGVEDGKFICVLPRLRYTPYYRVKDLPRDEGDYEIDAINDEHAARDHAPLRDLITLWVRETGLKVILCPEMTYEIAVAKEHLLDPLPADVKPNVIWRDTSWLADEAASVYAGAVAVVSAECHSPIIALSQGTPAFYVRNPPDTVKAQMFRDLGLTDWVFESGETTGQQLWETLKPIHEDRAAGRAESANRHDKGRRHPAPHGLGHRGCGGETPREGITMKLFVYGSLKRGFSNHHFLAGQEFIGDARTVLRFRMFDCGGFPGVVEADLEGGYQILGELWNIDTPCLRRIDWLEEVDAGVYTRSVRGGCRARPRACPPLRLPACARERFGGRHRMAQIPRHASFKPDSAGLTLL